SVATPECLGDQGCARRRGRDSPRRGEALLAGNAKWSSAWTVQRARAAPRSPAAARATDRPPYQLPDTKRMIGPKLNAAGAPTKCSPATELSRPRRRIG